MKRFLSLILALTIFGLCMVGAVYFCQFYYFRYQGAVNVLDEARVRIESFDVRLAKLETHKAQELKPIHVWGMISTSDQPPDEFMVKCHTPANRTNAAYYAVGGKVNWIEPEIRLPVGSTNSEFEIQVPGYMGTLADAWISLGEPFQALAAFDQFHVYCPNTNNTVKLIARVKPGGSVKMKFDMVVLCATRLPD